MELDQKPEQTPPEPITTAPKDTKGFPVVSFSKELEKDLRGKKDVKSNVLEAAETACVELGFDKAEVVAFAVKKTGIAVVLSHEKRGYVKREIGPDYVPVME